MPAYAIANIDVHTPEVFERYRERVAGTIGQYGGKYIVRGGPSEVLEGGWKPRRLVVMEFPSMAALKDWYHSAEYQAIVAARHDSAHSDIVLVEGLSPT
jgi:uncharacterized protein (DUF1330 family)